MSYTEDFEGIKVNVQAAHITISDNLQQSIRKMLLRLRRRFSELACAEVYFTKNNGYSKAHRTVSIRLRIPGNDAFASDSGDNWLALIKCVEGKLSRQLKQI